MPFVAYSYFVPFVAFPVCAFCELIHILAPRADRHASLAARESSRERLLRGAPRAPSKQICIVLVHCSQSTREKRLNIYPPRPRGRRPSPPTPPSSNALKRRG